MEDNKLFQIGDVAKMFHISVGSLRHYEKAGLLKPEYTDSETGYRYYSIRQFEVLNTIRYLRVLDMPLNEIGEFLKNRDIDIIEEKLLRQKEMVAAKLQELETIERKIDHRLQHLRDARNAELNVIHLKKFRHIGLYGSKIPCVPNPIWTWNMPSAVWKKTSPSLSYFWEKSVSVFQKKTFSPVISTNTTWFFLSWTKKTPITVK